MTARAKLAVVALVLIGGVCSWQRHSVASLEQEIIPLRSLALEAEQLRGSNASLAQIKGNAAQDPGPEFDRADLLRLRNEAQKLRGQLPELERLRAETARLAAEVKAAATNSNPWTANPAYVPKSAWTNVGTGSPEATVRTFFAAVATANIELLVAVSSDESAKDMQRQVAKNAERARAEFMRDLEPLSSLTGYLVAGQSPQRDGSVVISIQAAAGGQLMNFQLRLQNHEWRIDAIRPGPPP